MAEPGQRWLYRGMAGAGGDQQRWRGIPPAPAPHGSFLAWYRGCRCPECRAADEDFRRELTQRALQQRLDPEPYVPRLSADDRAHLEAAVRDRACPRCGALRNHRCRNLLLPAHFTATHPERAAPQKSA
jgi:hypothetical protein